MIYLAIVKRVFCLELVTSKYGGSPANFENRARFCPFPHFILVVAKMCTLKLSLFPLGRNRKLWRGVDGERSNFSRDDIMFY